MLNTVYFLSDNYDHFKNNGGHDEAHNFNLSFLTDCYSQQKLRDDYLFFSSNSTRKFSLTFKIDRPLPNFCESLITAFFFIPAYGNLEKTVNIICDDSLLFNEVNAALITAAKKQGIQNLKVNLLNPLWELESNILSPITITHLLFSDTNNFLEKYKVAVNNLEFKQKNLYLLQFQQSPLSIISALRDIEENFRKNHADLYKIIKAEQKLLIENILLKKKILLLYNELNNYKEHNKILRSTHGAKELQRYYDKEYELLPRWFKQSGHLLKVLLGKRTLRSLFNNNVKKYKD